MRYLNKVHLFLVHFYIFDPHFLRKKYALMYRFWFVMKNFLGSQIELIKYTTGSNVVHVCTIFNIAIGLFSKIDNNEDFFKVISKIIFLCMSVKILFIDTQQHKIIAVSQKIRLLL